MVDLNVEMAELWASLNASSPGRGRVVQLIAARRGEGTSTVARELAFHAASRAGRSVWLVDVDLLASPQAAALAAEQPRYGGLGEAVSASPDGSMFFTVRPPSASPEGEAWSDARFLAGHRIGALRWWVTRFRREALKPGQTVHVLPSGAYWQAMRRSADLIVVDTPSPRRSQAGLTLARFMDQTIMVVAADEADIQAPAALRDAVRGAGGAVGGVFLNRSTVQPPPFLKAILP